MAAEYEDIYALPEIYVQGISQGFINQLTPVEIILGESLLTPGLQTFVRCESLTSSDPTRDFDELKGKTMNMRIQRKVLAQFGINDTFKLAQTIYRVQDRKTTTPNTEEFVIQACDPTLLADAKSLVSKSWKCTPPSTVVSEVLRSCAGADLLDVQSASPARDYVAENIHPFQVVAQQANVALDGDDPSFVHWMTFGAGVSGEQGIHHFRSLKNLTSQSPMIEYYYAEVPDRYPTPRNILFHSFPCDFDLLSDILNGVDASGKDINSATIWNPLTNQFSLFGDQTVGCGIGLGNIKNAQSTNGSEQLQDACPDFSYLYIQKRQARMALLDQDKIALRLTVPWNPELHAGKVISAFFPNVVDPTRMNYGTGTYLISAMTHKIKRGGVATTTLDCVSTTVGSGVQ